MKKILVVVDMQVDFIDGSLGTNEAVAIIDNVATAIENFNGSVIFTKDTHYDNYLETQEGINLPVKHCIKGTTGHDIHPKLAHLVNDLVVEKITFGSIDLPKIISELNVNNEELEINLVGLCTDICVISNAMILKATYPQAIINVIENCCAGVTPQTHTNALEAMKMCQINII